MDPYLSVVIPAYNEADRIESTLGAVARYLKKQNFAAEVLIVIDGAKDATSTKAKMFAASHENVKVIDRARNRGKGFTVREGMLAARGQIRLFTDADNSTDISHFDKIKPLFDEGYAVVIASREEHDAKGARQAVPQIFLKRLLGDLGNIFIQIVAVPGIWDTQCGFKAFTREAAEKIFSVSRIDRWGFDVEALALARHFKFKIGMVPAYWVNDPRSHVSWKGYLQVLLETLMVRWYLITGAYDRKINHD